MELQIQAIERSRGQVLFRFVDESRVSAQKLLAFVSRNRRASFSPQGVLSLEAEDQPPAALFDTIHKVIDQIRQ